MSSEMLKTSWVEKMLSLYAEGKSDLQVCKELNITRKTFAEYYNKSPGFAELVDAGRDYAQAWYEEQGRLGVANKGTVDASIWQHIMNNRYGWANKNDTRSATISIEQKDTKTMAAELARLLPQLANDIGLEVRPVLEHQTSG